MKQKITIKYIKIISKHLVLFYFVIPLSSRWVRTRWALLVVFWLSWLGMLAGAVVIIVQAPKCKDLPAHNWWNEGPLYQIGNIQSFTDSRNLRGERLRDRHTVNVQTETNSHCPEVQGK